MNEYNERILSSRGCWAPRVSGPPLEELCPGGVNSVVPAGERSLRDKRNTKRATDVQSEGASKWLLGNQRRKGQVGDFQEDKDEGCLNHSEELG